MIRSALLLLVALLAACSPAPRAEPPRPVLTVHADSALTEAFTKIGKDFTASQGIEVKFVFGASSALQKNVGAGVDIYASASPQTMQLMSKVFARNRLVIATAQGNPKDITTVGALSSRSSPQVSFAMCVAEAPCGAALEPEVDRAGFAENDKPQPKVVGQDVKETLAKLTAGEVDAAIVYETDVKGNSRISWGPVRVARNEEPRPANLDFPIAIVSGSPEAKKFYDYVFSAPAQAVLRDVGFELP